MRERHILSSVKDTLACLAGAQWFSKLDANSGFWQVELDPKFALLTTFITPVWETLLEPSTIWDNLGTKTLSAQGFRYSLRIGGSGVND